MHQLFPLLQIDNGNTKNKVISFLSNNKYFCKKQHQSHLPIMGINSKKDIKSMKNMEYQRHFFFSFVRVYNLKCVLSADKCLSFITPDVIAPRK
jgi:hypothetical protein